MSAVAGGSLTSFAFCWKLERRDGAGLALTSHDAALSVEGLLFEPNASLSPAAITRGGSESVRNEAGGAITSDGLTEVDLIAGRWSGARSRLSTVQWAERSTVSEELVRGELGDVVLEGSSFQADLLDTSAQLSREVCPTTTPECRAAFGDRKCRVDLAGRRLRAAVVCLATTELTVDQSVSEAFARGQVRWLSGPNCGLKSAITNAADRVLHLREPPPFEVVGGEKVELLEGCDKRLKTCRDRFGNVVNFRGEPHLPGNDLLTRYPDA